MTDGGRCGDPFRMPTVTASLAVGIWNRGSPTDDAEVGRVPLCIIVCVECRNCTPEGLVDEAVGLTIDGT